MTVIGTLISERYRLEEKIGSGGMSSVYRAFDPMLERWVAIKLMHRDISHDPDQLERFRREARTVAQLNHPHVVTVIDAGEDDGAPYIVFEYVEGETLKERIRRLGRLPVSEAVAYAIEIGRALDAAHASRLVHRDVKPQNVLIDRDGRAKVTDFGIARSLEAQGLTATGRVLGTTDYVSPEQALGHEVTGQSDIYSLGIVVYEMLTGETPFKADTQVAVAMRHVRDPLPDVQRRRPEISASLAAVVEGATALFLVDRTEKGTGGPVVKKPAELSEVRLGGGAASDYDPEGDNKESPDATRNAIDGNRGTNWNTETYQGGFEGSNKSGVGLYVDAGKLLKARGLTLVTATPGFTAAVYGSETVPAKLRGWTLLSPTAKVNEDHTFRLRTRGRVYRYYLLWISALPEDGKAEVQELSLLK